MKNVKFHGKNGFKEAVKGIMEKKKNFSDNKGTVSVIVRYCILLKTQKVVRSSSKLVINRLPN